MSRKRKHKRAPKRDTKLEDIPLTPMIDVVFQLLIYFVWTFEIPDQLSQMHVHRPAPPPPGVPAPPPPINTHRIGVYENFYSYNDTRMPDTQLRSSLTRIANANPEQHIIILATGNSLHERLVWVLNTLHDVGLKNISLLSAD